MIPDTSHLFRQLELAFCPNKEWEKKGSWGGRRGGEQKGRKGELGRGGKQAGGGLRRVLGKGKVQVEGAGRQNQMGAEKRVKEDDQNINVKRSRKERKLVKDGRSSHFLWGRSKLGWETNGVQDEPTL